MKTAIVLFGRKSSGKNTIANYIEFSLIGSDVTQLSFAGEMKETCINLLGLTREQCYGSEDQKNTLTKLLWENFPIPAWRIGNSDDTWFGVPDGYGRHVCEVDPEAMWHKGVRFDSRVNAPLFPRTGPMTARQVMQSWGTEIFRKADNGVHVGAVNRKIDKGSESYFIVTDGRFKNEAKDVIADRVYRIGLTRKVAEDKHASESAVPFHLCDVVINNHFMTLSDTQDAVEEALCDDDVIKW